MIGTGSPEDGARAAIMAVVALAWLAVLVALVPYGATVSPVTATLLSDPGLPVLLVGLWTLVAVEGVAGRLRAPDGAQATRRLVLVCLVPAFRMTVSPARPGAPAWGAAMERRLAGPMIAVSLLAIPAIAADLTLLQRPYEKLNARLPDVTDIAVSQDGQRLFLLDDDDRVIETLIRERPSTYRSIGGYWRLPKDAGPPTRLRIVTGKDEMSLGSGCALTAGLLRNGGFTDLRGVRTCPPRKLETLLYWVVSFIRFAFAAEFVLLVSLARRRADFCKRRWTNILVILLPLLAFLRLIRGRKDTKPADPRMAPDAARAS